MKIIVAVTGASGSLYALLLIKKLQEFSEQLDEVAVVMSKTAEEVWKFELPNIPADKLPFRKHDPMSFFSPLASGSSAYDGMIVIPCSMGTLGRIAHGTADDLITRAADVILKERKKLILVARETPYNRIHLQNMLAITDAGGIICPASPHFYKNPQTVEEVVSTVVERVLKLVGINTAEGGFLDDQ